MSNCQQAPQYRFVDQNDLQSLPPFGPSGEPMGTNTKFLKVTNPGDNQEFDCYCFCIPTDQRCPSQVTVSPAPCPQAAGAGWGTTFTGASATPPTSVSPAPCSQAASARWGTTFSGASATPPTSVSPAPCSQPASARWGTTFTGASATPPTSVSPAPCSQAAGAGWGRTICGASQRAGMGFGTTYSGACTPPAINVIPPTPPRQCSPGGAGRRSQIVHPTFAESSSGSSRASCEMPSEEEPELPSEYDFTIDGFDEDFEPQQLQIHSTPYDIPLVSMPTTFRGASQTAGTGFNTTYRGASHKAGMGWGTTLRGVPATSPISGSPAPCSQTAGAGLGRTITGASQTAGMGWGTTLRGVPASPPTSVAPDPCSQAAGARWGTTFSGASANPPTSVSPAPCSQAAGAGWGRTICEASQTAGMGFGTTNRGACAPPAINVIPPTPPRQCSPGGAGRRSQIVHRTLDLNSSRSAGRRSPIVHPTFDGTPSSSSSRSCEMPSEEEPETASEYDFTIDGIDDDFEPQQLQIHSTPYDVPLCPSSGGAGGRAQIVHTTFDGSAPSPGGACGRSQIVHRTPEGTTCSSPGAAGGRSQIVHRTFEGSACSSGGAGGRSQIVHRTLDEPPMEATPSINSESSDIFIGNQQGNYRQLPGYAPPADLARTLPEFGNNRVYTRRDCRSLGAELDSRHEEALLVPDMPSHSTPPQFIRTFPEYINCDRRPVGFTSLQPQGNCYPNDSPQLPSEDRYSLASEYDYTLDEFTEDFVPQQIQTHSTPMEAAPPINYEGSDSFMGSQQASRGQLPCYSPPAELARTMPECGNRRVVVTPRASQSLEASLAPCIEACLAASLNANNMEYEYSEEEYGAEGDDERSEEDEECEEEIIGVCDEEYGEEEESEEGYQDDMNDNVGSAADDSCT